MDPGQGHRALSTSARGLRWARVTSLALDTGPVSGPSALLSWGPRGSLSLVPGARREAPRYIPDTPGLSSLQREQLEVLETVLHFSTEQT